MKRQRKPTPDDQIQFLVATIPAKLFTTETLPSAKDIIAAVNFYATSSAYREFLAQFDECGECGNAACRGVGLWPMRINGETVARCWGCLDLTEASADNGGVDLLWAEHTRDGSAHVEWHAPCGCAYHPKPFPHVHPCSDEHNRIND